MYRPSNGKAVILLSGGLDSATVAAIAADAGFTLYGLSFRYGQRHAREADCAAAIARHYAMREHITVDMNLAAFGGSSLTDSAIEVPKNRAIDNTIPSTYVPARNTIFLSYAAAFAETRGADTLFIGANYVDYSGYPDCRPAYLRAFEEMINLGTAAAVNGETAFKIEAPLLEMSKKEIIRKGLKLRVPYEKTHSCYDPLPDGRACGACDSCALRLAGFAAAGAVDPVSYAARAGAV